MKHPVEIYLSELYEARSTGGTRPETSYYTYLENLLNEIGKNLKPRVRCTAQVEDTGAGSPDFGLYSANQFQKSSKGDPIPGVLPERGVIEVKKVKDDSWLTADGEQVTKYWGHYGQVLVTNYRDFLFVGRDEKNKPIKLEPFHIAATEREFWKKAQHPRKTAEEVGDRLIEYLKRVMLNSAPLSEPQVLAWYLASYAREARFRIDDASDLKGLDTLRRSLEDSLGMKFEGKDGEHFFRATLVQTLFYGIFSSWVLWARTNGKSKGTKFHWHDAAWSLHVPMIAGLFHQIADPKRLKALGLSEVLDWTGTALNRVTREEFFAKFEEENAVQYFYEPFLEAYDPQLRKDLGVWYTPHEIIKYQVARVDTVLREELEIPDGLADPNVFVLDPCCGTGAYLVEVLRSIHKTLTAKGSGALVAQKLKHAAMDRVFGFEIMPAPFVISHLQLGLTLRHFDAPLSDDKNERVGVYLTNALTGWEPIREPKNLLLFPELKEEHDAAEKIKRATPVLVILGNPPYNGYAGIAMDEERVLSEAYRTTKNAPRPQGQGLNDLFVRFYGMAERKIVSGTGKGVVCFISNFSWLDGLSHSGMRETYANNFDCIWIDCLNGDKYRTGKLTPDGAPDPSVFSTDHNREGIQVGTAISLLVKKDKPTKTRGSGNSKQGLSQLQYRSLWGKHKLSQLLREASTLPCDYSRVQLVAELGFPFMPMKREPAYQNWPKLTQIFPVSYPGIKTSRDPLLVDISREVLVRRIGDYFDKSITHDEMREICPCAMEDKARFPAVSTREHLQSRGTKKGKFVQFSYRPFDVRWLYWEPDTKLLDEKRSEYVAHVSDGNLWLAAVQNNRKDFDPPIVTDFHCAGHIIERGANLFPSQLTIQERNDLFTAAKRKGSQDAVQRENLSELAYEYLALLGRDRCARTLLLHSCAVQYAPCYGKENADVLKLDWPRIPLPNSEELLLASAELGEQIALLLNTEKAVSQVSNSPRRELAVMGVPTRVDGKSLNPHKGDFDLTAGWGHGGKDGVTMPGRGKIVSRAYTKDELDAIEAGAKSLSLTLAQSLSVLGKDTRDIYLNDVAYWKNVPAHVWDYYIGGYQVIKKWLSYRERPLLGRPLNLEEVEYVQEVVRRLTAIVLLQPALDENYQKVKANTYLWPKE